jgi:uncharacterized delta-60 repeat protein
MIVAAIGGDTSSGSGQSFLLQRWTTSGSLNLYVGTGIGIAANVADCVALQSDGKMVLGGYAYNGNTNFNDFALVRYNTDGTLDTSFHSIGKVTTPVGAGNANISSMAVQADGKILVAGQSYSGGKQVFTLARYYGNGSTTTTTTPADGSFTNNNKPVISGSANAGNTVNVYVDGSVIGTTTADGSGAWSLIPTSALPDGIHTVAATQTDTSGSTGSLSNSLSFTVDTAAPASPVITAPSAGATLISAYPIISGTAEAGSTVTIRVDGSKSGSGVAGNDGKWSITVVAQLTAGAYTIDAAARDKAGNDSAVSSLISFSTVAGVFGGPGDLDPTFGNGGIVTTAFGSGDDVIRSMVLQPDGKIVVAGYSYSYNGNPVVFSVARYNLDGSLDTTFNGTGKVATSLSGGSDYAAGVTLQNDGKIVVAGQSNSVFALARYNSNGSLDTTFGPSGNGKVVTSGVQGGASAVAVQADGKIVVTGGIYAGTWTPGIAVVRYNSDGSLDSGFGTGGRVSTNVSGSGLPNGPTSMVLQSDGKIVVGGYNKVYGGGGYSLDILRYNIDGTLDTTFASLGYVQYGQYVITSALALQADGMIVAAIGGDTSSGSGQSFLLQRWTTSGSLNLYVGTGIGIAANIADCVALQSDGKMVLGGYAYNGNTNFNDFALVRYNTDGTLDTSFHSLGKVTTPVGAGNANISSMAVQADGKILVAGQSLSGTKNVFTLARYYGTNAAPQVTTGSATGIVRTGAVLNGMVNPYSLPTTAHFEYGLTTSYGSTTADAALGNAYTGVTTSSIISGLTDNTLYHYRLVATSAAGTTYGADATFTTAPNPPLAFTGDASNVSATGATLVGTVLPNGRDTTAYFEFGLTTVYGTQTNSQLVTSSATIENVFAPLTGLTAGATYHFRLVAINAGSPIPITGLDKTFVAQAPPPVVTLGAVAPLTTTSVSLSGTVNANGATTQIFFDYGTDGNTFPNSVTATPTTASGTSTIAVSGSFTSLSQGVTYYYRLRAVNAGGTSLSSVASFTLDVLSGLTQVFPTAAPDAYGFALVTLTPAGILSGWRFVGEQSWRASGVPAVGLTTGDRDIEFRPVPGYIQPPQETVSIISGAAATVLTRDYFVAASTGSGGISVTLKPDSIAASTVAAATRAQWRFLGEDDTQWRDTGATVNGLAAGSYSVECKPVSGRATPSLATVLVLPGQTSAPKLTYFLADTVSGTSPSALAFESFADRTKPYAYVGQIRSSVGVSTGFVVMQRVVATAGHVVFDDGTLSTAQGLQWLYQREAGTYEPVPQTPRGYYIFDGYTAQRAAENTPGTSSPQSQTLDVAAMYFLADAGRGGSYGGFLASDNVQNEFLISSANKILVGYPVNGIATSSQGRMFATPPANVTFTAAYGRTYTTADISSVGGNSGGPLCVQYQGGAYYPAAVYLGGTGQTVARAIDSAVIDLFNRAQVSGNGGANNTGGGITQTNVTPIGSASNPGSIAVTIAPAAAVSAGAGWRLSPETSYRQSGAQKSGLSAGSYVLQLTTVAGYQAPTSQTVTVAGGQVTNITFTYAAALTAQETWRQTYFGITTNSGNAADNADPDGDGMSNLAEYTAGTNPNSSADVFKVNSQQKSGSTFTLTTSGKNGRTYVLERSTTLNSASWTTVTSQGPLGADASVTLADPASPTDHAFYRIRVTAP